MKYLFVLNNCELYKYIGFQNNDIANIYDN